MLSPPRIRILVADADPSFLRFASQSLKKHGYEVSASSESEEILRLLGSFDPQAILIGAQLTGQSSAKTLGQMKQSRAEIPIILVADPTDTSLLFQMSKAGADDCIPRTCSADDLANKLTRVLDHPKITAAVTGGQVRRHRDFTMLFGTSPKMEEVKMTIEQVAETNATVLIRGESGTGKEVVARMVHGNSPRSERPFVKVNCAAIPHELLESELFGYEPGAFTGAHRQKLGKFDLANNGTIFLDEISEMHPALQAKLLHVLQDGEFARLGGKRDIGVDVRVLAATNKLLERNVAEGAFREDLFYRLNVVTIHIPPLRERREEIPVFLEFFLQKYSEYYGKQPAHFSEYALQRMMEYSWPGNIRELENLVKRYTIVGNEAQIIRELSTPKPIFHATSSQSPIPPASESPAVLSDGNAETESPSLLEIGRRAAMHAEREAIERVLAQTRWNRRQAAKILKVSYKALLNKLKIMEEQDQANKKQ